MSRSTNENRLWAVLIAIVLMIVFSAIFFTLVKSANAQSCIWDSQEDINNAMIQDVVYDYNIFLNTRKEIAGRKDGWHPDEVKLRLKDFDCIEEKLMTDNEFLLPVRDEPKTTVRLNTWKDKTGRTYVNISILP